MVAAAPIKSSRFFLDMNELSDASDKKSGEQLTRPTGGEKRKSEYLEPDGLLGHEEKKEVLWRANFEEFERRLRIKMCVAFVTSRVDKEACVVFNAVLELIGQPDNEMSWESEDLAPDEGAIYDEVLKNKDVISMDKSKAAISMDKGKAAISMDKVKVFNILSELQCQMLVECKNDRFYSVDFNYLIKLARMDEVESIVLKRFDRDAFRIFRLLSKAGKLVESEKIASETFLDKEDAMKNLYTLWTGGYIQMEKVNVSQGVKITQFSLWKVNEYLLGEHVLDEMYHAALNLRLVIARLLDREKELLIKLLRILKEEMEAARRIPKEKMAGDMEARGIPKDKKEEDKKAMQLGSVWFKLEKSLMDLNDDVLLFTGF